MVATFLFIAISCFALGAFASAISGKNIFAATLCGVGGVIIGSLSGVTAAVLELLNTGSILIVSPWSMPFGSLSFKIDTISSLFMVPLFLLSGVTALYGSGYLKTHSHGKNIGLHWCFFNILVMSMTLVTMASSSLLFLLSWELMSLSSFFLVLFDHQNKQVRDAGWMYLAATHIGMVFLLLFFLIAQAKTGSSDFTIMSGHGFSPHIASMLFVFSIIGFGSKAGFVPFHVWLPEAHPAAPSHVSALMSGVMIKMGIYGIVRVLMIIGPVQSWWGIALIFIGAFSGIFGILSAIGQKDLKRMLAYSSVENIGIITIALGCGVLGIGTHNNLLALFGCMGALVHIINHSFFKGLLFLCAGSVLIKTNSLSLEKLGGLMKKMPLTGGLFLMGAIAICGIPPLNGFISEFLIFIGAFNGIMSPSGLSVLSGVVTVLSLALIGGLALACFTKAFGVVFMGSPREQLSVTPEDPGMPMVSGMAILAVLCITIGTGFMFLFPLFYSPMEILTGIPIDTIRTALVPAQISMKAISASIILLILFVTTFGIVRRNLLLRRNVRSADTWGCGYTKPTPRMQYTASSFSMPLSDFFGRSVAPQKIADTPASAFPVHWTFETRIRDLFLDRLFRPGFHRLQALLGKLHWLQGGRMHAYVLYIAVTIITLFIWKFLWNR
jgi:formate hydrogenlyase subunit 3/multisubunit Na+/H+ antiporter MnhD subunit